MGDRDHLDHYQNVGQIDSDFFAYRLVKAIQKSNTGLLDINENTPLNTKIMLISAQRYVYNVELQQMREQMHKKGIDDSWSYNIYDRKKRINFTGPGDVETYKKDGRGISYAETMLFMSQGYSSLYDTSSSLKKTHDSNIDDNYLYDITDESSSWVSEHDDMSQFWITDPKFRQAYFDHFLKDVKMDVQGLENETGIKAPNTLDNPRENSNYPPAKRPKLDSDSNNMNQNNKNGTMDNPFLDSIADWAGGNDGELAAKWGSSTSYTYNGTPYHWYKDYAFYDNPMDNKGRAISPEELQRINPNDPMLSEYSKNYIASVGNQGQAALQSSTTRAQNDPAPSTAPVDTNKKEPGTVWLLPGQPGDNHPIYNDNPEGQGTKHPVTPLHVPDKDANNEEHMYDVDHHIQHEPSSTSNQQNEDGHSINQYARGVDILNRAMGSGISSGRLGSNFMKFAIMSDENIDAMEAARAGLT